jgi:hypothetical protein
MDLLDHFSRDTGFLAIVEAMGTSYRLWRGEGPHDQKPLSDEHAGRWFTPDRLTAEDYAYKSGGHLLHLDVTEADKEHITKPDSTWPSVVNGDASTIHVSPELAARSEHHPGGCPSCDPGHDETHRHQREWLKSQAAAEPARYFHITSPGNRAGIQHRGLVPAEDLHEDEPGESGGGDASSTWFHVLHKAPEHPRRDVWELTHPHLYDLDEDSNFENGASNPFVRTTRVDPDHLRLVHEGAVSRGTSLEAAARPGRGEKVCPCCQGEGEHGDGSECDPCDGQGIVHSNEPDRYCPGQPQPRRRHWREGAAVDDEKSPDLLEHFQVAAMAWENQSPRDKTQYTPISVRHAGFAGLVGDSEYDRELREDTGEERAEDGHFDEDLYDDTSPEPTHEEKAHYDEHDEWPDSFYERHDQAYEQAVSQRKKAAEEEDTPDHEDEGLMHFVREHGGNTDLWKKHGEFGPVDIKHQPVYATQSHVAKEHIERYQGDRQAPSHAESLHGDRSHVGYLGDKHPLFVTHEGRVHTIEGHHRVATDMAMGRHETLGWHFNLDKHPRLADRWEEDPEDWEGKIAEHHQHLQAQGGFEHPLAPGHLGEQGYRVHDENRGFYAERDNWSGHQPQQTWGTLHLHHPDGTAVAHLDYAQVGKDEDPHHEMHVEDLRSGEGGKGYASALMDHVYATHPEPAEVSHSLRTDEGGGWWEHYIAKRPEIAERERRQEEGGEGHEVVAHFEEEAAPAAGPRPAALPSEDWEEHLRKLRYRKRNEPLMHRGMAIELPPEVHDFVHDQCQTRDRQAQAILDHLKSQPLGMHWSTDERVPRFFAGKERKNNLPGSTKVILHAKLPGASDIETDPQKLQEEAVFRHDNWMGGEHEIPMKAGAPVHVTGVTWYGYGNRKRTGHVWGEQHLAVRGGEPEPEIEVVAHFEAEAAHQGPLTMEYAHNTEKAPDMGEIFGQHVEPHGRYMVQREPGDSYGQDPRWVTGTVTFHNPLHVPYGGLASEPTNWKHQLSEQFGGKRGKALSRAVTKAGHDAIVTHDEDGSTREIVDLTGFHRQGTAEPDPEPVAVVAHFEEGGHRPVGFPIYRGLIVGPEHRDNPLAGVRTNGIGEHWTDDEEEARNWATPGHDIGNPLHEHGIGVVLHADHPGEEHEMPDWRKAATGVYDEAEDDDDGWGTEREIALDDGAPIHVHHVSYGPDFETEHPVHLHAEAAAGGNPARLCAHFEATATEHTGMTHDELDQHLETWFRPQRLDAERTTHPRSGYQVETGTQLRLHQPSRDDEGPGEDGVEGPVHFEVWDHGDPHTQTGLQGLQYPKKTGETRPVEHVYRGVSADEWRQAQQRGHVQSDGRGTIGSWEGTNADVDPKAAVSYLPRNATGHILKIRVHPDDGWFTHSADSYVRTRHPVPLDRVEAVSPEITKGGKYGGEITVGKTASLQATAALENPYTGHGVWYHGTQADPEDIRQHGLSNAGEHATGRYQVPESESDDSGHWNAMVGSHFTADHAIAGEFAKGEHEGSDNEGYWGEDEPEHHGIIHAYVHLKNPKVYSSEHDMDHEAYEHEFAAGNHPSNHHPGLGREGDADELADAEEMWPHAHRIARDYGHSEIPRSVYGHHMSPFEQHPMRTAWLNTHPDKVGIADRFKQRLMDAGHDGIVYGNEYERSNRGAAANSSVVAFHPHQVEITQHHHVDEPHDPDPEPSGHLAALASLPDAPEQKPAVVQHFGVQDDHEEWERRVTPPYTGQPLFHGTRSILEPDEELTHEQAAEHANNTDIHAEPYVHATSSGAEAHDWGKRADSSQAAWRMEELGRARDLRPGENEDQAYPSRVYQVHPLGDVEPDPHKEGASYRSASPMRVIKEVRPLSCYAEECDNAEHWPDHPHYEHLARDEDDEDMNHYAAAQPGQYIAQPPRTAAVVAHFDAGALSASESPGFARGVLEGMPALHHAVAGSLEALAGSFAESPVHPHLVDQLIDMASAARSAESHARDLVAQLPAAEGVCEPAPKA